MSQKKGISSRSIQELVGGACAFRGAGLTEEADVDWLSASSIVYPVILGAWRGRG